MATQASDSSWTERLGLRVNPQVFFPSTALIFAVLLFATLFTETASTAFSTVQSTIIDTFGWFYTVSVAIYVLFILGLCFSRYGSVKLGPDDAEPDYSYTAWFAMLFSAGMGIGLLFYGVAEPVLHFTSPPVGEGGNVEAARKAMEITFFHWGIHAWSIYIVVGLSLAYFAYRHDLPLTLRSALYPLIGDRIYGPIGHVVDTVAVLGTLFGVATSLGFGVTQVNAGLHYLVGIPDALWVQLTLIAGITAFATISVVSGLDAGIRRLSEANLGFGLFLLVFVFLGGSSIFLLDAFLQNVGGYLQNIVSMTFQTYAFQDGDWKSSWTLMYWGWWTSWSPFVGMFIARVSRGRTIREFIGGVLLVPTVVTLLWMTIFGESAIQMILGGNGDMITQAVNESIPTALFAFLDQYPLSALSSGIATLVIITFFITSSDSGSLVIDIITAGGRTDPPVAQRVFWAVTEGTVAAVLLLAGGLSALQTASITTALPFTAVLLIMCYGLWKGLRAERIHAESDEPDPLPEDDPATKMVRRDGAMWGDGAPEPTDEEVVTA
jgi:choline/glycine/proline betaine transport protein